jgi:restriction endonuclease S subunit
MECSVCKIEAGEGWRVTPATKPCSSFLTIREAGRIDAEYFKPKYYRLMEAIGQSAYEHSILGELVEPIRNGFDYREFVEQGTPYIRVGDIKHGRIELDSSVKIPISSSAISKDIGLQVGDILFTRKGTYGNAAIVREGQEQAVISSEIMLLRLRQHLIASMLPDYLSLFLNSAFGYLQVTRRVHGVAYYSISQADLAQIQVVIPPPSMQKRLAEPLQLSLAIQ